MTPEEFKIEMSRLASEFGGDKVYTPGRLKLIFEMVHPLDRKTFAMGIDQLIVDNPPHQPPLGPKFRELFINHLERARMKRGKLHLVDSPRTLPDEETRARLQEILGRALFKEMPTGGEE